MEFTEKERQEIIYTIQDKEDVPKEFFEMVNTLKAVAEIEIRAVKEQASIDKLNEELKKHKHKAEYKARLYTRVLELIQYNE